MFSLDLSLFFSAEFIFLPFCLFSSVFFSRLHIGALRKLLRREAVARWTRDQEASDQTLYLVDATDNFLVYRRNCRARDTAIGAYFCRRKALERTCDENFLGLEFVDMPFVHHSNEAEFVRCLRGWLQRETKNGTLDLT